MSHIQFMRQGDGPGPEVQGDTEMEKIIVSVQTTNAALKAHLREPTTKEFKRSARGLIAAVKWAGEYRRDLIAAQGNLSRPRVTLTIDGAECDFDWIMTDLMGEPTVKNAEKILAANYEI